MKPNNEARALIETLRREALVKWALSVLNEMTKNRTLVYGLKCSVLGIYCIWDERATL